MKKTILVIGGTGLLGEPVARRLSSDGKKVRLLTRNPDKARAMYDESYAIIPGDVTDVGSIRLAMEGCSGVHISLSEDVEHLGAENTAETAAELGIDRLTYLSAAATFDENSTYPSTRSKLMAEKAIRSSGVPSTIFCPTRFMESLPLFIRGGRAVLYGGDHPPAHWVAGNDYARMVSSSYEIEAAAGKKLWIYGPEPHSIAAAVEKYLAVLQPGIRKVSRIPYGLGSLKAFVLRRKEIEAAIRDLKYFDRVGELGDPTEANDLLGAPETSLEQWLAHRQERSS